MSGKHPRRRKRKKRASPRFPNGAPPPIDTRETVHALPIASPVVSLSTIRTRFHQLSSLRGSA